MYSCNKTRHWVERTYKATVISSRLCHSSVVSTIPLASLAVRFATTGKPSNKQNLLKTSKTVDTYNKCLVLKIFTSIKTLLPSHRSLRLSPQLMMLLHFRSHSLLSPSDAVHTERNHMVQVSSVVLHFVPQSPFGRRAVHQQGYGLQLLIFKSRSESDKKRRNCLQ